MLVAKEALMRKRQMQCQQTVCISRVWKRFVLGVGLVGVMHFIFHGNVC